MADENKPAFYPRVGNIKAKNFRSAQPAPFINDPRAMEMPQLGEVDIDIPTKENRALSDRMGQRRNDLERQRNADMSPLEKVAGALEAVRFMGSALTQSINSLPTRIVKGDEAADKFIQERIYKPTQPKAYEYAQDIGDFLEKLETEYKIPPVLPEAMALQYLAGPATSQATRGALQAGAKLERSLDPMVTQALERGGLQRDLLLGLGQGTQSNVIKPKGGNWFGDTVDDALNPLKRNTAGGNDPTEILRQLKEKYTPEELAGMQEGSRNNVLLNMDILEKDVALNNWVDRNLANYVKKEMATPEDPVRRLAEQGVVHFPVAEDPRYWARKGESAREDLGGTEMAQSDLAKQWENRTDSSINRETAKMNLDMMNSSGMYSDKDDWLKKLPPDTPIYSGNRLMNPADLGFDHILDVLRQDVIEGRIRPDQLNKVSMEQAVRRTYEYDQEMARKMRETALKQSDAFPLHKDYPEGYKWIELTNPKAVPEGYTLPEGMKLDTIDHPRYGLLHTVSDPKGITQIEATDSPESALLRFYNRKGGEGYKALEDALTYEGNTMGHCVGGYCPDVSAGRSRIFSLRDAKGEPHVTVEVRPKSSENYALPVESWFESQPQEVKNAINEAGYKGYNVRYSPQYKEALSALPPDIIQIKGKQNAAPKTDYLPYVQDFVRSGKWGDVGDLKNTGLYKADPEELGMFLPNDISLYDIQGKRTDILKRAKEAGLFPEGQKYLTRDEWEDILRKQYQAENPPKPDVPPDLEGMKRGGKVSITNNPDTMMLELNNQKMKNGVPAYGAGKAVSKQALKAAKPELMKASEALGKIEGRPLVITQADRTKVGGGYLGGPGFSSLQLTEPEYRAAEAAWGVKTPGVAKMILGGAKKAGENPVFTTMIGSPTQHQSNQMVFDKLYGDFKKSAKKGNLDPELRDKINMRLASAVDKEGNPVFPPDVDIMDKKFRDIANTFDRRSIAGHLMGGVQVGGKKGQIIDYDKIIRETTDPALLDVPSGALGNRLFTLSGGIIDRPDLHPAFPTILQGEDLGLQFNPVAKDILMRDFIEKTMREKGRKPGYMDFTRGHPPSQLITEDILTEMQKLGLKEGGEVKKPAAKIDGNEFVLAAQKYGIKDSMNNLNKIVDLVNKGLSVDDAARQVADTGIHKAAGGAITGDDLIIEERPL